MTEFSGLKNMDAVSTGVRVLFNLSGVQCLGLLKNKEITPKPQLLVKLMNHFQLQNLQQFTLFTVITNMKSVIKLFIGK